MFCQNTGSESRALSSNFLLNLKYPKSRIYFLPRHVIPLRFSSIPFRNNDPFWSSWFSYYKQFPNWRVKLFLIYLSVPLHLSILLQQQIPKTSIQSFLDFRYIFTIKIISLVVITKTCVYHLPYSLLVVSDETLWCNNHNVATYDRYTAYSK